MKVFEIPEEIREEEYEEDGEKWPGDGGKCGGCNWEASKVFMCADTPVDAVVEYLVNHRGLCGECMAEMLAKGNYGIVAPEG